MVDMSKFLIIVLCHCRPNDTTTVDTLRKCNYTGDIVLLLDDEDPTVDEYRKNFPSERIEIFSKDEMLKEIDIMNNEVNKKCAVYARNACFKVAKKLGYEYFCQMDDDYVGVPYRYRDGDKFRRNDFSNLDEVFKAYLEFFETNDCIHAVAFAEPGHFVGGQYSNLGRHRVLHMCMGSWICKVDRPLKFSGIMNDDVNTYALYGSRGQLCFTFDFIMIDTPETQKVQGGMTDVYLGNGTYTKTMYTVMCCPSFVKVDMFGDRHYRMHHKFNWPRAVPKIISGRYKKE